MEDSFNNPGRTPRRQREVAEFKPAELKVTESARPSRRICVLDADPAVRDGLLTLLSIGGHEVAGFSTAAEFHRSAPEVDFVICEARLPDASGFDVYRRVCGQGRPITFVMLVSGRVSAIADQAQRLGIQHVFAKPLVSHELLALMALSGTTDSAP